MKPPYRDGKVYICTDLCDTCVFRPGNLMHLEPGRLSQMVHETQEIEGGNVPCHKTLDGDRAICRGWWNRYAKNDLICRLAMTFGIVTQQ